MTTDITELAQRMKAAAVRAKTATEEYASGHMSVSVCYAECEEFNRLTDGPDNILALVEALASEKRICATWRKTAEANSEKLEKAQQRIGKLEKKITDHKRMNQEMAKAMLTPNDSDAAGMEIAALRQRIAELESRTVTPVTYSENADADYCRKWAWEQVKGEVSTEDWTTGDSITYFGFFSWGWDMRRQYNEQRPVTVKLPQRLQPGADGWDDWYVHSDDEGEYLKFDDVLAMLTAAGIKVEAELCANHQ
ncbi:hypothetical protein M4789_09985 [Klebsiella pneumoniae subsp. pneumoniae]|nr:hypothetical protein [Klebsiella pneumoniae]MCS6696787.1 hypothetical protein [Klebsiella pneumoniae subsp. pneumoniae]